MGKLEVMGVCVMVFGGNFGRRLLRTVVLGFYQVEQKAGQDMVRYQEVEGVNGGFYLFCEGCRRELFWGFFGLIVGFQWKDFG